jgi:hypothetical protein
LQLTRKSISPHLLAPNFHFGPVLTHALIASSDLNFLFSFRRPSSIQNFSILFSWHALNISRAATFRTEPVLLFPPSTLRLSQTMEMLFVLSILEMVCDDHCIESRRVMMEKVIH